MPSTKVIVGTLTALLIQAAIAITGNPTVISWLPIRWQGIVAVIAGAIAAYWVTETRPAPSSTSN